MLLLFFCFKRRQLLMKLKTDYNDESFVSFFFHHKQNKALEHCIQSAFVYVIILIRIVIETFSAYQVKKIFISHSYIIFFLNFFCCCCVDTIQWFALHLLHKLTLYIFYGCIAVFILLLENPSTWLKE